MSKSCKLVYRDLIKEKLLNNFSLIITCRENYIQNMYSVECDYITLQPWEYSQIQSFCNIYSEKTKHDISNETMINILKNKEVFGIPLILYMVLALDISIEKEGSIVDVYDQIFSLKEGGIYERCFKNLKKNKMERYSNPHWIRLIKKQIHQISRGIAIWMFENNPDGAFILQDEYRNVCSIVIQEQQIQKNEYIEQDFLIGSYFKLVRHCEGVETEELCFVHRSIYEYFVAEAIFSSIENAMIKLSNESQKEFANNIAVYLKQGRITYTIGEYLKHKIVKLYNKLNSEKQERFYQWWENAIGKMMDVGMFYYTKLNMRSCIDIIHKECRCFVNLIEILRLLLCISERKYIMEDISRTKLEKYIQYSCIDFGNDRNLLNFSRMYLLDVNLSNVVLSCIDLNKIYMKGAYFRKMLLEKANLREANLRGADLIEANLREANLRGANLIGVNLIEANLRGADLKGADLKEANLREADLIGVDLTGANLTGVNLREAVLGEANLGEAVLRVADLRGADLKGANLGEADLRKADLRGADLKNTNLDDSIWYKNDIPQILPQLKVANFTYINIEDQCERKKIYRNELFPDKK